VLKVLAICAKKAKKRYRKASLFRAAFFKKSRLELNPRIEAEINELCR
jgi:hypothetical protein